jgi:hypothetical protein
MGIGTTSLSAFGLAKAVPQVAAGAVIGVLATLLLGHFGCNSNIATGSQDSVAVYHPYVQGFPVHDSIFRDRFYPLPPVSDTVHDTLHVDRPKCEAFGYDIRDTSAVKDSIFANGIWYKSERKAFIHRTGVGDPYGGGLAYDQLSFVLTPATYHIPQPIQLPRLITTHGRVAVLTGYGSSVALQAEVGAEYDRFGLILQSAVGYYDKPRFYVAGGITYKLF